jgi:tripartite motif-containing protein 71
MSGNTKQNRFWILCAVLFCAVLLLVSAAAASTTASITITGVYKGAPPQPDFTYTPTNPITGQSVTFTGTSTGSPISWSWNFGDSTTGTGQTTSHSYSSAGTYTVTLTVTNSAGLTGTKSKPITVTAPPLTADFTAAQTNCVCSWKVTFNDISTGNPTSRVWAYQKAGTTTWTAFGSGATSPTLSFSSSATYNIRLIVYDSAGKSNTAVKSITPGTLKAAFSASPVKGLIPLTVTFTDSSIGLPTRWKWEYQKKGTSTWTEFGSGAKNPSIDFLDLSTSGKYSIRLTVTNTAAPACGSNTITKTDYITVMSPCDAVVASFTGYKTSGYKPLTVKFTDSSTGPVGSWAWDFQNDGTVDSTLQNPSFTYTTKGTYSVKLKVTNICGTGTSTLTRTSYITVK